MTKFFLKNTPNAPLLLLAAYTVATGFAQIDILAVYTGKIQVPEFVFLLIFPILVWYFIKNKKLVQITLIPLDYAIFCYWLLFIVVSICANHPSAVKEIAILSYLIIVYGLVNFILCTQVENEKKLTPFILSLFTNLGLLNASIGILGWLDLNYWHWGWTNGWGPTSYYPYLGQVARSAAFCSTPGMLASLLGCCFLMKLTQILHLKESIFSKKDYLILGIIGIGIVLTFAKTIVIIFAVALLIVVWSKEETLSVFQKRMLKASALCCLWVWLVGTHILFLKTNANDLQQLSEVFTVNHPFTQIGNWQLVETNYSVNKRCAILVGCRFFPLGVGPGEYESYVDVLREEGLFPSYLPNYDPHCIYTGVFAELGFIGILILLWIAFILIKAIKRMLQSEQNDYEALTIGIVACIVFGALDGISADIRNARYFWIILAIFAFLIRKKNFLTLVLKTER